MIARLSLFVLFVAVCGVAACPVPAPQGAATPKVDAGPPVLSDGPITFLSAKGEPFAELRGGELRIADGYTCADVALAAVETVRKLAAQGVKQ